jgi:hypothetical protein
LGTLIFISGYPKIFAPELTAAQINDLPNTDFSYLAIVDAGSSGCRAHVFRYGLLGSATGAVYVLPKHTSRKVKPGLSTFAENPSQAGESLQGLIEFMKSEIPEAEWPETPIWLKATAGLRMLDVSKSDAIMSSVRDFLSNKSPFYFEDHFAAVISGQEEGALGWISVNYMKKIIGPFSHSASTPTHDTAFAVVEMGGASTQVTQIAPVGHKSVGGSQYLYTFSIQNHQYTLYTHSYLGYGSDQARVTLNSYLHSTVHSAEPTAPVTLVDPCLNPGYMREATTQVTDPYKGPSGKYHVIGGGDDKAEGCHHMLEKVLFRVRNGVASTDCDTPHSVEHTSFNCIYQPSFVRKSPHVLVFENFYYAASGMGVQSGSSIFPPPPTPPIPTDLPSCS